MTRAKDISKILTDANISGNIDVDGVTNLDVVDIDGALTQDGGAVFNEASADVDFRVETDANTHGLFVDGGSDLVSIGQSDLRAKLSIGKAKSGSSAESSNLLSLEPTGTFAIGDTANITFHKGSTTNARISGYYGDDNIAYGELVFSTRRYTTDALNEGFRLDNRGALLVGTTTNGTTADGTVMRSTGEVLMTRTDAQPLLVNRAGSAGTIIEFRAANSAVGSISTIGGDIEIFSTESGHKGLRFGNGAIVPTTNTGGTDDDACDLGGGTQRFDDIFATNGTIQTSDRNEKQDIEELTDAEKRVAVVAKGLMRKYRWKSKVAEKGDNARTHFGIIAQDLQDAFTAESLDASKYAMFCSDTWWEKEITVDAIEAKDAVLEERTDEDGNKYDMLKSEAVEAKDGYTYIDIKQEATTGYTEKTRLGVRYPELLAFIISAI